MDEAEYLSTSIGVSLFPCPIKSTAILLNRLSISSAAFFQSLAEPVNPCKNISVSYCGSNSEKSSTLSEILWVEIFIKLQMRYKLHFSLLQDIYF